MSVAQTPDFNKPTNPRYPLVSLSPPKLYGKASEGQADLIHVRSVPRLRPTV